MILLGAISSVTSLGHSKGRVILLDLFDLVARVNEHRLHRVEGCEDERLLFLVLQLRLFFTKTCFEVVLGE